MHIIISVHSTSSLTPLDLAIAFLYRALLVLSILSIWPHPPPPPPPPPPSPLCNGRHALVVIAIYDKLLRMLSTRSQRSGADDLLLESISVLLRRPSLVLLYGLL